MPDTLLHLDPSVVLADDNSRFNLKKSRVDALAASILESGEVLVPVEVELLHKGNGHTYRLTSGFYRHAAVTKLNAEQNAGLMLPAIARKPADSVERLRHQLFENMERENQSPMDQATAIQKLVAAGVSRAEIRRIFSRPGGRKGNQVAPASNAWINITLRFLELPKSIQEKIHDGRVGMAAAYELGKVPPDRRAAVLERAEAERMKQIEQEEKDEEKYLSAEKRAVEAETEQQEAVSAVDQAKAAISTSEAATVEKTAALRAIQKEPYLELDDKGKASLRERLKAAETDLKGAQKAEKDAKNDLAKVLQKATRASESAAEHKAKLDQARKAVKAGQAKKAKVVGKDDVAKAAKAEGVETGTIPLNMSEIKQTLKDLGKMKELPKVQKIAASLTACFAGVTTPKQLAIELDQITK